MAGILFLVRLLVLEVFICIQFVGYSSSLPCSPNSWIQLPGANVSSQMMSAVDALNLTDCQSKCLANSSCTGVAWNETVSRCYFNLDSSNIGIDYLSGPNSTYYGLIRNYSSCDKNNYNCSLTWIGVKDFHGFGASQIDRDTLVDCIRGCQDNLSCDIVEWNYQENSCWVFAGQSPYTSNQLGIFHFTRNCTNGLPSTAGTTRPTTPGPNTTTSTSSSTSTVVTPTTQSSSSTTTTTTTAPTSLQTPRQSSTTPSTTAASTSTSTAQPVVNTTSASVVNTTSISTSSSQPVVVNTTSASVVNTTSISTSSLQPVVVNTTSVSVVNTTSASVFNTTSASVVNITSASVGIPQILTTSSSNSTSFGPNAAAQMSKGDDDWYPLAIKPAYIVLAGVGGGCILLVITAVVILCEYSLNKSFYSTSGSSGPSPGYQTHHHHHQEEARDYVDAGGDTENMGMSEVEMDIDKKPYGNAEEFQRD